MNEPKNTTLPILIDRVHFGMKTKIGCYKNRVMTKNAIEQFLEEIRKALIAGEKINLVNLCSLEPYIPGERTVYDMATGETRSCQPKPRIKTIWSRGLIQDIQDKATANGTK